MSRRPEWLTREYYGDRVRWQIGGLLSLSEKDSCCKAGKRFVVDLALADHVGEFDDETFNLPHTSFDGRESLQGWNEAESHYYLSYSFYLVIWRWGIAVQWRGREIGRFDWRLPNEDDEVSA
jgi:hypothetical protein